MAINLTTAETVADIQYQGITSIEYQIPHYKDTGDNNAMKIDKNSVQVMFIVTTWTGDGEVLRRERYTEVFSNWPASFVTDTRAVYDKLEQYAVTQGYIGNGTGEVI